jgi:hypothetical protein
MIWLLDADAAAGRAASSTSRRRMGRERRDIGEAPETRAEAPRFRHSRLAV